MRIKKETYIIVGFQDFIHFQSEASEYDSAQRHSSSSLFIREVSCTLSVFFECMVFMGYTQRFRARVACMHEYQTRGGLSRVDA